MTISAAVFDFGGFVIRLGLAQGSIDLANSRIDRAIPDSGSSTRISRDSTRTVLESSSNSGSPHLVLVVAS